MAWTNEQLMHMWWRGNNNNADDPTGLSSADQAAKFASVKSIDPVSGYTASNGDPLMYKITYQDGTTGYRGAQANLGKGNTETIQSDGTAGHGVDMGELSSLDPAKLHVSSFNDGVGSLGSDVLKHFVLPAIGMSFLPGATDGLLGGASDMAALGTDQVAAMNAADAAGSTFGQLHGSAVGNAFGAATPEMGSGLLGQTGALAQGADGFLASNGLGYVSPAAMGSITGAAGMSAIPSSALADFAATTGLGTSGLAAAGGALSSPIADGIRTGINGWQDALEADAAKAATADGGLLDTIKNIAKPVTDFAKDNPLLTKAIVAGAGGLLSGAGTPSGDIGGGNRLNVGPGGNTFIPKGFQYQGPTAQTPYSGGLLFGGR